MRGADRIGQAEARTAAQRHAHGVVQRDPVADRDPQRRNTVARAQEPADDLAAEQDARRGAASRSRLARLTAESRLADADRGKVEHDAEVARQPETAGVDRAVAVDEEQIGSRAQSPPSREYDGHLAKGEQSGNVREGHGRAGARDLDDAPPLEIEQRDGRVRRAGGDRDVDAGDETRCAADPGRDDQGPRRVLEFDRRGG